MTVWEWECLFLFFLHVNPFLWTWNDILCHADCRCLEFAAKAKHFQSLLIGNHKTDGRLDLNFEGIVAQTWGNFHQHNEEKLLLLHLPTTE